MKRWPVLALLAIVMLWSCQRDATIGPPDLLYKRWHLTQARALDSNVWQTQVTDAYYTVEYRPDGNIIYARNGVETPTGCCQPSQFSRQGLVITFSGWNACPNALCSLPRVAVAIRQLTDTTLEVNDAYNVIQYEAAL